MFPAMDQLRAILVKFRLKGCGWFRDRKQRKAPAVQDRGFLTFGSDDWINSSD
jgi:hypothetical protein